MALQAIGRTRQIIARLLGFSTVNLVAVRQALIDSAELVIARARTHYLAGEALNAVHSRSRVTRTGVKQAGRNLYIQVGTNVKPLIWWESGFDVPPYNIYPVNAKALRFAIGGDYIFAKRVSIPARTQEAKPWLAPSFEDEQGRIRVLLTAAGMRDMLL